MARAINVASDYIKKSFYAVTLAVFSIACLLYLSPQKAQAQVAVPVVELPGSPLFLNTISIMESSSATSWNTAVLAAKETGLGQYQLPGTSAIVPITGLQVAAQAGTGSDSLAGQLIKPVIRQFTNSIVDWINHGFRGGPGFVTNPEKFFMGVADRVVGNFLEGSALEFLCSPFALDLRLALNINYSATFEDEIECTLTDVVDNVEGFLGDFSEGGWQGWFELTQKRRNNPYGAYLMANNKMYKLIADSVYIEGTKLNWGKGFLSWEECLVEDTESHECIKFGDAQTPGTVVEAQLEKALDSNLEELQLADEFDEILAALLNQLMQQVILQAGGLLNA